MDRANWEENASHVRRVLLGDAVESVVVCGLCHVALQMIAPIRVSRIIQSRSLAIMDAIGVDAVPSLVYHQDLTAWGHRERLSLGIHRLRPISSSPQGQSGGSLVPTYVFLLGR